jgi:hypothetical protein
MCFYFEAEFMTSIVFLKRDWTLNNGKVITAGSSASVATDAFLNSFSSKDLEELRMIREQEKLKGNLYVYFQFENHGKFDSVPMSEINF